MPKVSVIVPVYNVAKFLPKCLQSICNQTLRDIEIIVVNDGSKDESLRIVNKFAQRDARIVVVDQKNQGLGYARNSGIRIAKGEYISFIDSDDWIDKGMMEAFYLEASRTDADLVIGTFYEASANERIIKMVPIEPFIWQHKVPFSWREHKSIFFLPTPVWDKFYRRTLLEDNNIWFSKETCEDIDFKWKVFTSAARISTLPEPYYYYRVRGTSLTSGKKVCVDVFRAHDSARRFLADRKLYDDLKIEFNIREMSEIIYLSWKARPALISDSMIFTAYYNLSKKAIDAIDFNLINWQFSYLNFPYMFLALHIKYRDRPQEYLKILQIWNDLAVRYSKRSLKFGKYKMERGKETDGHNESWQAIERSLEFFGQVTEIVPEKNHYEDESGVNAVTVSDGNITILPPISRLSGPPIQTVIRLRKPNSAEALSFIAWTYQPERVKAINVFAELREAGDSDVISADKKTMASASWYALITLDLKGCSEDALFELTLYADGNGDFPLHFSGVRLSHFQFH